MVRLDRTTLTLGQLDPLTRIRAAVAAEDREVEQRRDDRAMDVDDRLGGVVLLGLLPVGLGTHVTDPALPDVT
jgi:hypothetical protein